MINMITNPCGGSSRKRNPEDSSADVSKDEPKETSDDFIDEPHLEAADLSTSEIIFILLCSPRVNIQSSVYYWSTVVDKIILLAITIGCVCFIVSTLPQHRKPHDVPQVVIDIELVTYILFTVEYVPRLIAGAFVRWDILRLAVYDWRGDRSESYPEDWYGKKLWDVFRDPMHLLDLLAIVPYWIALILHEDIYGATVVFRLFRLIRITRVFQVFFKNGFGRSEGMILWMTVTQSAGQIIRLALYYGIAAFVFGTMIFYAEMGEYKDDGSGQDDWMVKNVRGEWSPSQYRSILDGAWWFLVTGTSVGYGDIYPETNLGRAIATIAIMIGLITIALPIGIIQTQFYSLTTDTDANLKSVVNQIFDEREERLKELFAQQEKKLLDQMRALMNQSSAAGVDTKASSLVPAPTVSE